ncbi:MAG: hypothetical protein ACREEC_09600, partial [Thermoplasmata archaeon]
ARAPPVPATATPSGSDAPVSAPARAAPPPLPERVPPMTDPLPIVPRPLSQCFVCGSVLEAGSCPHCRMTWIE